MHTLMHDGVTSFNMLVVRPVFIGKSQFNFPVIILTLYGSVVKPYTVSNISFTV